MVISRTIAKNRRFDEKSNVHMTIQKLFLNRQFLAIVRAIVRECFVYYYHSDQFNFGGMFYYGKKLTLITRDYCKKERTLLFYFAVMTCYLVQLKII